MVLIEKKEGVAIVLLNIPPTNALTVEVIESLSKSFREIENDNEIQSIVLTSSNNKIFSFGFNLPELISYDKERLKKYFDNFNKLCLQIYSCSKPVIAALNGFTIAGGFVLALCCDYRLVKDGNYKFGLNEVKLEIPVPWLAQVILKKLAGLRIAEDILLSGRFYSPHDLQEVGLVDRIYPQEILLEKALEKASEFTIIANGAYRHMKKEFRTNVISEINQDIETQNSIFYEMWFKKKAQEQLREAASKF